MQKTINFFGLIVGLIGLAIGIVSYFNTVKDKEISYNVLGPSYKVFDKEAIEGESSLKIFAKDSSKINQNIYLTTISIWNSGDLTINKSDVRKQIAIELKGINKIIDFKVIKEIESGVSKFTYEVSKDSIYNFDWNYFDPKHGLKFQVLYVGEENITGKLKGNILETDLVEFVPAEINEDGIENSSKITKIVVFSIFIFIGITTIILSYARIRKKKKTGELRNFDFIMYVIYPIILCIGILYTGYILFFKITEVPF
ncbi:hypothetical protein [Winogradskyella sp. MH6]|uniref:hypothetical protein n=1 Tax=Winogradskyella sp. MH6 TaxID=2929510 RepID=UPI001FB486B7|nr:hypothetical protein [Winogradskyella sp. MH6]